MQYNKILLTFFTISMQNYLLVLCGALGGERGDLVYIFLGQRHRQTTQYSVIIINHL